jgi:SAM-dependent methyltransferase
MGPFTSDPRRSADRHYLGKDPFLGVSGSILAFVRARAGHAILDFGCGTGGDAAMLQRAGFEVAGVDSNPAHVATTASLGVPAHEIHGRLPFADGSFDTLVMIEVLEHLGDDVIEEVLADARRVVRRNVLITVPNCGHGDELHRVGLTHEHFLAMDHVQFFTRPDLEALLGRFFPRVQVEAGDPGFPHLLLPALLRRPLSGLRRAGLLAPSFYSRLFAEARIDA